jgi:hypothetical protein
MGFHSSAILHGEGYKGVVASISRGHMLRGVRINLELIVFRLLRRKPW